MSHTLLLRNGRVIDPANNRDEIADLAIVDGRIAPLSTLEPGAEGVEVIDCKGLIVAPGLIDIHVHLREPTVRDHRLHVALPLVLCNGHRVNCGRHCVCW